MDVIRDIVARTGFKLKDVTKLYDQFMGVIHDALIDGYEVSFQKLGKLYIDHGKPRRYTSFSNPDEYLYSTTTRRVRFRTAPTLKEELFDLDLMDKAEKEGSEEHEI